ncbi:anti-repressor protein [Enterococcus sp. AZ009]|uniref:BRO family protein n=1 Tax=Enterococcus TaxID=1350 RepID=UPI001C44FEE5|nr:phage repressor protein/antirepressor Ant [Enterococcus casseliflavus]
MNQTQIFNFEQNKVRTVLVNDVPYFVGKDIAEVLGYSKPRNAISIHVDVEDKQDAPIQGALGGKQSMTIINESGLYSLIFKSKLPNAKKFKRWVTSEVLPSIRQTGTYTNIPQTFSEALRLAADTEEERARMEKQIKLDAPYTMFGKAVSNSDGAISIGEFCKIVYEKHGISIGRNKMFSWLRKKGYLISYGREKNNPKQKYIEQGLFVSNPVIVPRTQGNIQEATTLITGKGQVYFLEKLQEE